MASSGEEKMHVCVLSLPSRWPLVSTMGLLVQVLWSLYHTQGVTRVPHACVMLAKHSCWGPGAQPRGPPSEGDFA